MSTQKIKINPKFKGQLYHPKMTPMFSPKSPSLLAVREDRMRGGRNKFGVYYKADRAARQKNKTVNGQIGATLNGSSVIHTPNGGYYNGQVTEAHVSSRFGLFNGFFRQLYWGGAGSEIIA